MRWRNTCIVLSVLSAVSACNVRPREASTRDPEIGALHYEELESSRCNHPPRDRRDLVACTAPARPVQAWGPPPRGAPPIPQCPVRVRLSGEGVVADTLSFFNAFDPVPWDECIPDSYLTGMRRALHVDDGWLIAYSATGGGELLWKSEDGSQTRSLSSARVIGFSRARSGTILALAVGRARLGRGGVLAFDRRDQGNYSLRLVATLPLEPSSVAFDDGGWLVGFAKSGAGGGFVFRVDETGKVENVHYVARDVGRVASLAKSPSGLYYLGLECGILRLVPERAGGFREEWWSARDGASGRWTPCLE